MIVCLAIVNCASYVHMRTYNDGGLMNEQDEAVEEKVTALLPSTVLTGLVDANWKERLSAVEKMSDV